jgi:hypothetical protein
MKKSNLKQLIKEALEAETIEMVEPYNEVGDIILVMKPRNGMTMNDMIRTTSVYDDISKDSSNNSSKNDNNTNSKSIYEHIFEPSNCFGKLVVIKLPNIYTTNIEYLKDTQQLLSSWSNKNNIINNEELQDILNTNIVTKQVIHSHLKQTL